MEIETSSKQKIAINSMVYQACTVAKFLGTPFFSEKLREYIGKGRDCENLCGKDFVDTLKDGLYQHLRDRDEKTVRVIGELEAELE